MNKDELYMGKYKYYWIKSGSLWEMRQYRFLGKSHPHDICAIARNEQEARNMMVSVGFDLDEINFCAFLPKVLFF